jgi:hypothetical protein
MAGDPRSSISAGLAIAVFGGCWLILAVFSIWWYLLTLGAPVPGTSKNPPACIDRVRQVWVECDRAR